MENQECKICKHDLSDREIELEKEICSECDGECHCSRCEVNNE